MHVKKFNAQKVSTAKFLLVKFSFCMVAHAPDVLVTETLNGVEHSIPLLSTSFHLKAILYPTLDSKNLDLGILTLN